MTHDPALPPFSVERPATAPWCVFDSPHSGRAYPASFVTDCSRDQLRWAEDAYVDDLLEGVSALGAALLTATYPRAWLDLNRPSDDIDESLLAGPWPGALHPTEKSRRGLGLIRRFVVPGVPIYDARLPVAEVERRIALSYEPYHGMLRGLLVEARAAHQQVLHINWHSMKSHGNAMTPDGPGAPRADFVVSDRLGASAAPAYTAAVAEGLRALGYTVSVNDPYTGGTIVQRYGRPDAGVHSVQVEINRALYLDEATVTKTVEFPRLRGHLRELTSHLAGA